MDGAFLFERLRVEFARLMMETGRFSAEEIARKNGFGNRERMRRSWFGHSDSLHKQFNAQ